MSNIQSKLEMRNFNKSSKGIFSKYLEKKVWEYHRANQSTDTKVRNMMYVPTSSSIKKWFSFWNTRIDIDSTTKEWIKMSIQKVKNTSNSLK